MRCFVFVLMIILLPLRGWAGDVMATHMATTAIAIERGAASAHAVRVANLSAVPDCHETQATYQGTANTPTMDPCGTCAACQACHTVAVLLPTPSAAIFCAAPQMQQATAATFTSAEVALDQRPPIL